MEHFGSDVKLPKQVSSKLNVYVNDSKERGMMMMEKISSEHDTVFDGAKDYQGENDLVNLEDRGTKMIITSKTF